jgi:hypothetical protein
MVNDWLTGAAVAYTIPPLVPPVCAATMVHRPDATIDTVPPLVTVQVPLVVDVKVTAKPESLVAVTGKSAAVTFCSLNAPKVIVCVRREVNERVTVGAVL